MSTSTSKSVDTNFRNKAQETTEGASQFGEKAKDAATCAVEKTKDTVSGVVDRAKDAVTNITGSTKDAATAFGNKAEDATHAVGRSMGSLAGSLRQNVPQSGMLGTAASTVASGLENTGRYLEQEGLKGIGEDVMNMVRRNPLPALLIGIGFGYLIARATTSRNV